jgi:hypothetical protein
MVCSAALRSVCATAAGQNSCDVRVRWAEFAGCGTNSMRLPLKLFACCLPADGAEGPQITPYLLYQTALAWNEDELRQERWSQVKNESDLLQLRAELRNRFSMIGGLPTEKTEPARGTITGTVSGVGFHIEKLIYQSLPGFYVTALVYVPENGDKLHPAILVPAGHSADGKNHYQALCERLALRGYLVDQLGPGGAGRTKPVLGCKGKEEPLQPDLRRARRDGKPGLSGRRESGPVGVWDGMRAVDYLLTRPDVDGSRINITGTSGGGFQTALLGALDDSIKVIIPSCYITALPMRVENRIFADYDSDPEQDLFGLISKGVDNAGMLLMMYPRPVMMATATLDFFPVQGAHKSYAEVSSFYKRFGHADRIDFAESYNRHEYSLKNQEAALNFSIDSIRCRCATAFPR